MNWLVNVCIAASTFARAIRSPFIRSPGYAVLFFLIVGVVLLICTLPEAAFVIPALDFVGLDIVTLLVALELRHYVLSLARLAGVPPAVAGVRPALAPLVGRCLADLIAPTNPRMCSYAWAWILVGLHIIMGRTMENPRAFVP